MDGHQAGGSGNQTEPTGGIDALVAALYQRHGARIFALCLSRLGNAADAEDAVQETFARLPRALRERGEEQAAAWLSVVAVNVCRHELRRRRTAAMAATPEPAAGRPVDELVVDRMVLRAVWSELSPRERLMLLDRFRGHSYEETSRAFGSTVGAAITATSRARARARDLRRQFVAALTPVLQLRAARTGRRLGAELGNGSMSSMPLLALTASCLVLSAIASSGINPPHPSPAVASVDSRGTAQEQPLAPTSELRPASPALPAAPAEPAGTVSQGSPPPAGGVASPLPPVEPGPGQEDQVMLPYLTASPAYATDGTLFASTSYYSVGPSTPLLLPGLYPYPVLFKSTDRGAHWTRLPGQGFLGGKIMLSPLYPADPTLLAESGHGLTQSDDGGVTFRTVAPTNGDYDAVDPSSTIADLRVMLAQVPLLVYHAHGGTVTPGPVLPPNGTLVYGLGYLDKAGDVAVLVGGYGVPSNDFTLFRCGQVACTRVRGWGTSNYTTLLVSPNFASDGRLVVYSPYPGDFWTSSDGGGTWTEFATEFAYSVTLSSQAGRIDGLDMSVAGRAGPEFQHVGFDGSVTFRLDEACCALELVALLEVPEGRLIGSEEVPVTDPKTGTSTYGFRCSDDRGHQWVSC